MLPWTSAIWSAARLLSAIAFGSGTRILCWGNAVANASFSFPADVCFSPGNAEQQSFSSSHSGGGPGIRRAAGAISRDIAYAGFVAARLYVECYAGADRGLDALVRIACRIAFDSFFHPALRTTTVVAPDSAFESVGDADVAADYALWHGAFAAGHGTRHRRPANHLGSVDKPMLPVRSGHARCSGHALNSVLTDVSARGKPIIAAIVVSSADKRRELSGSVIAGIAHAGASRRPIATTRGRWARPLASRKRRGGCVRRFACGRRFPGAGCRGHGSQL